jgi:hypothetical protein
MSVEYSEKYTDGDYGECRVQCTPDVLAVLCCCFAMPASALCVQ